MAIWNNQLNQVIVKRKLVVAVCGFGAWCGLARLVAADFEINNEAEFRKVIPAEAKVEALASGFLFVQGPVWVPADGGFLIFSDVPKNELKKYTKLGGVVPFRKPSNHAIGNTLDREGRLLSAESDGRRISITEKDGQVKTLVDQADGKKLNSPQDLMVKSDGTVWFSDPTYGLGTRPKEQEGNYVFRFDPKTGKTIPVIKDCEMPNGLCFSPDEKKLYVADAGEARRIRVFEIGPDGLPANGKVFAEIVTGVPAGMRCDAAGWLWTTAAEGVRIYTPGGELIGKVLLHYTPSNLAFGGADGKTLFITARKAFYSVRTAVTGAQRP